MNKDQDSLDLARLHTEEADGGGSLSEDQGLTDDTLLYLQQIKDLQEKLQKQLLGVQETEMAILGYSYSLQEELENKKGH